jgi:hypothetical protein
MTNPYLEMLKPTLPPYVKVTGFTALNPAPSASEGGVSRSTSNYPNATQHDLRHER